MSYKSVFTCQYPILINLTKQATPETMKMSSLRRLFVLGDSFIFNLMGMRQDPNL